MENSKRGYSKITKLRIKNTLYNPLLPESAVNMEYFSITNSDLIRYEMTSAFQKIFNAQPNLHNTTVAAKKSATLILFANISAMKDRIFMKFET